MRSKFLVLFSAVLLFGFIVGGCQQQRATAPAKENIERSLEQSGMNNVDVDEDREHKTVRLTGEVRTEAEKQQAEQIAKQAAPGRTVANEIMVKPAGEAGERAETIQENTDDAIKSRLKAEMARHQWDKTDVDFDVKNGVVTLKGDVPNAQQRSQIENMAKSVPGVKQVVDQIEVKGRAPAAARE